MRKTMRGAGVAMALLVVMASCDDPQPSAPDGGVGAQAQVVETKERAAPQAMPDRPTLVPMLPWSASMAV